MTDDLVKRLRDLGDRAAFEPHMHHAASDRIEQLERELDEFRRKWERAFNAKTALEERIEELDWRRDAAIAALEDSSRKRGETLALLDKAVVALRAVLRNTDKAGEGVILIVDLLNARAVLAEIEGGKKDE